ncbi:hypothetical protein [Noviherbaspirillum soli]|uniref:hypothetical protein n=1 Tax=Noviherbaspirillum soli TaxID=1064518 RepID=UPI00188C8DA6|nr:hypothetical protein [Noviherbaspirillum soli]
MDGMQRNDAHQNLQQGCAARRHDVTTGDESLKAGRRRAAQENGDEKKAPSFDGAFSETNDF